MAQTKLRYYIWPNLFNISQENMWGGECAKNCHRINEEDEWDLKFLVSLT